LEVRERIRINGQPLSKVQFDSYFWDCYSKLYSTKVCIDMSVGFKVMGYLACNEYELSV